MDLLSRSNIEYIEKIHTKLWTWEKIYKFLCRLKYMRFLLLYKMPFFTNLDKTLFQSDETL